MNTKEILEVLKLGDVVNFDSRGKWYMRFVFSQIRRAQKKKFGKKSRYRDIHSVLVLDFQEDGTPMVLSATVPVAVIEPLLISKRTKKVTVCRLKGPDKGFSDEWIQTMRKAAMELVGRGYDYLQMLAIKLKLQGWPKWITCWLDLGKKRTVCSGAVQYCLFEAFKRHKDESLLIQQPLWGNPPNETYPAHFVNDQTFCIVKEWKS